MFRYQGLIDLGALTPLADATLPLRADHDVQSVTLPGMELRWKKGSADISSNGSVLALAAGHAQGAATKPGEAANWLKRYERRDIDAADDVGGSFAVVIIDLRERRVLLFVDRFAIEPLCYRANEGSVAFADAASAVLTSAGHLDSQALFDYLYFHMIPAPQTIFADVRRLERAHRVTVSTTAVREECYWNPAFVEDDRRDLAGRLRRFVAIVEASVAQESLDTRTACFLSGGIDSSTVAGMLTRIRGEPAHAYSIGFEAAGYDEMAYARIAARHFGLVHHEYYVTPDDVTAAIPALAASFDQPFGNSSVVPAYYCALRAKNDGFTRILAGDGGDELFAGNSRYGWQKVFDLYHRLPRAMRMHLLEPPATSWTLFQRVPVFKQLGGYVRHSRHPMPDRLETFQLLDRLGHDSMFEPEFRARIDPGRPLALQRATWDAARANSLVNRMLAYDWTYTLADNDLPKVRAATQLAGVAVGYPLLSRALTEFSLSVPPEWKLKRLKLRWFYKEALRGFLPAEILRKKKHGFGLPFGHWVLAHAPLRELVEQSLRAFAERGIVRRSFVQSLLQQQLPAAPGFYGEMAWILVMLEQWLAATTRQQPITKSRVQRVT